MPERNPGRSVIAARDKARGERVRQGREAGGLLSKARELLGGRGALESARGLASPQKITSNQQRQHYPTQVCTRRKDRP